VAITFKDFRDWLEEAHLDLARIPVGRTTTSFLKRSHEGSLYPIDGGMIAP
jgi:hypothetical protein